MTKKKTKITHAKTKALSPLDRIPFIEHLYELRRRLFYIAVSMVFFGGIGYSIQQTLIDLLLKPAEGQQFIYTSPGGGINFLFQVCIYFGVILSVPVMVLQLLRYLQPLIPKHAKKFIVRCSIFSVFLALFGLCFGYFVGLPAALQFLAHQFTTDQVKPLFTIQEYMSFVSIYLIGSAVLFQIPLIMLFINRITPLKPMKLFKIERFVVLGAFVIAAFITPTPDIYNQCIIAGPIIVVYQIGVVLVWLQSRRHPSKRKRLEERDAALRAERLAKLEEARLFSAPPLLSTAKAATKIPASVEPAPIAKVTKPNPVVAPMQESLINRYRRNRPVTRSQTAYQRRPVTRWNELSDIRPVRNFTQTRTSY